jgi:O-antigen/teichoic acid export membrane protein
MLYFRQILIMLVSLYTVRVVLNTLGAEDYGIYNVVAGVVAMFGFLSGSMAVASQRYFSFEIGQGDLEQLRRVFSLSLIIYILIALLVLLLAETVGLWFVSNKLLIPLERKIAALWIFQFSILSFLFTILGVPYMADIIAHEDMNIYAYVSIIESALKFLSAFLLLKFNISDKLKIYGLFICLSAITITAVYMIICMLRYKECRIRFYWDTSLVKELTSYTGWNLFGTFAGLFKNQGVNILLNQYFNPVIVATRGIALQVNGAVVSFSQNFSTALRPQIIKKYALKNEADMLNLVFQGAKITFLLMYIIILPLFFEMPYILSLWLNNPPEYSILFTRLTLIDALIESMSYTIMTATQATGKIKIYQAVVGGILLLNLPITWIALMSGGVAYTTMIIAIICAVVAFFARLLVLRRLITFPITEFFQKVIVPILFVVLFSVVVPVVLHIYLEYSLIRFILVSMISVFVTCILFYIIVFTKIEKKRIIELISNKIHRIN